MAILDHFGGYSMPGIAGSQGATHLSGARLATLEILRAVLLDVARNLTLLPAPVAAHHHLGFTPFFLIPALPGIRMLANVMAKVHQL